MDLEEQRRRERLEDRARRTNDELRRRQLLEEARRDFGRHQRPIPPHQRPDIRDRHRWADRYDRWHHYYPRPLPPPRPIYIVEPIPFPEDGHYWDRYEVVQLAQAMEALTTSLYQVATQELPNNSAWNNQALSLLYDVVIASQEYSNAVDRSMNVFQDTIYELFNLEEAVERAASHLLCGPVSPRLRENFAQVKYYVAELLWQYRLDSGFDNRSTMSSLGILRGDASAFGAMSSLASLGLSTGLEGESVLACGSYTFASYTSGREAWALVNEIAEPVQAETLTVSASSSAHASNGLVRINELKVYYTDGLIDDLINKAKSMRDPHVRDGVFTRPHLVLGHASDSLMLPLDGTRAIHSVGIVAEGLTGSPVEVRLSLTAQGRVIVP